VKEVFDLMRGSFEEWNAELERSPEDWSIRIRLIESAVRAGDLEEARRLVRSSPESDPLPGELRDRIHMILTGGADSEWAFPFVSDEPDDAD
jgi:hypothetical protein